MKSKSWFTKSRNNRNRRQPTRLGSESLERREMFAIDPYLVALAPSVDITPILTVGDSRPETNPTFAGEQYRMAGIPDGLGAFDNGDGTFTVLMNHEIVSALGTVREHGSKGAFVSRWVIDKATLQVLSGDDLFQSMQLWDVVNSQYVSGTTALSRLCSADLPSASAFFNANSGLGTTERIFMDGEEVGGGRALATVVNSGVTYELPRFGKMAFENSVANPFPQDKTIVVALEDGSRNFTSEGAADPCEVYVYVGQKQAEGTPIERAGLTNGALNGIRVGVPGAYKADETTIVNGDRFDLASLGDVSARTAAGLQSDAAAAGVTQFRRVEDGSWDPNRPNIMYFVTTDRFDTIQDPGTPAFPNTPAAQSGLSRLWRLTFDDITHPELGGTIEYVVDGTGPEQMFDNITVNYAGNVLAQEDPGNQAYVAKIRQFDVSDHSLIDVAIHNPALFDPNTAPVATFLTKDEESSGIIDLSSILGPGYYLADVQAHYLINTTTPHGFDSPNELVEGGQLLVINTNAAHAELSEGLLKVSGTINDDKIDLVMRRGNVEVRANGRVLGAFPVESVARIEVDGSYGDDKIAVGAGVHADAILMGGAGNDWLTGGGGNDVLLGGDGDDVLWASRQRDILIGGRGADELHAGRWGGNLLVAGTTDYDTSTAALWAILAEWSVGGYVSRVNHLRSGVGVPALNAATTHDDGRTDNLFGGPQRDWFLANLMEDVIHDLAANEFVN